MKRYWIHRLQGLTLLLVAPLLVALAGCEQDEVPTGPEQEGASATLEYVGYPDTVNRNPSCISCHQENTSGWKLTHHADAFTTLLESSDYEPLCRACHTTGWDTGDNIRGADDAWAEASEDTLMFRDVQCEACHGPASLHNNPYVADPTDVKMPDDEELWEADLCGGCHNTLYPSLEEWGVSAHSVSHLAAGGFVTTDPSCSKCHVGQAFVNSLSAGSSSYLADDPLPITCQACHDPHSSVNPGQLRLPLGSEIICSRCHTADGTLPGSNVHQAAWEVFTGTLGFTYPDSTYQNSSHTTVLAQQACITCHMYSTPLVDISTPAVTGHTFEPKIETCTPCHPGATSLDIYGVQTEIEGLIDQLRAEVEAAGPGDKATAGYANALYILQAMEKDGSRGIHNTKYTRDLLQDAIDDFEPTGTVRKGSR